MSEVSIFSLGILIGAAGVGIAKLIGKACGAINQYQPKNDYLATPEREMVLQTLYAKNFARLEDEYLSRNSINSFFKDLQDNPEHSSRLKAVHAMSMFESISQVEPVAFVIQEKYKDKFEKVSAAISAIKNQLKAPTFNARELDALAEDSESLIRKISNDTHSLLAEAEEQLALSLVSESMSSLAYQVKTSGMALVASKGDVSVRARIEGGQIKLDTTSFAGISCHAEIRKIEKDLAQRGLIARRLCENHMRQRKGRVSLRDPFPAFGSVKGARNSDEAHSRMKAEPDQTTKGQDPNRHTHLLLHRDLQKLKLEKVRG